jgi:rod shape determining protein RodA
MSSLAARFEAGTLARLLALSVISVTAIYSATALDYPEFWRGPAGRQLVFALLGTTVYLIVQRIDYRILAELWKPLYIVGCVLLLLLLAAPESIAPTIGGNKAWFKLGPASFQPSELMKPLCVIAVAVFLTQIGGSLDFARLLKLGILIGIPIGLILLQPDMGTALTFVPLAIGGAWFAGIRLRVLAVLALMMALLAPVGWFYALKPYQKERILTVFDPSRDEKGSGYQVIQSRIAVGSGQLDGKGLFHGSQSRLKFLPARETDFVLAVVAEETGFIGIILTLAIYMSLVFRALETALTARDLLGTYLAGGIAAMWTGQLFINVGMVTGILPTIGVPAPLLSYGGSSVLASYLAFALIGSIRAGRIVNA